MTEIVHTLMLELNFMVVYVKQKCLKHSDSNFNSYNNIYYGYIFQKYKRDKKFMDAKIINTVMK